LRTFAPLLIRFYPGNRACFSRFLSEFPVPYSAARNAPVSGFYLGIPPLLSRSLYIGNNSDIPPIKPPLFPLA
jgi:hypothetical protein